MITELRVNVTLCASIVHITPEITYSTDSFCTFPELAGDMYVSHNLFGLPKSGGMRSVLSKAKAARRRVWLICRNRGLTHLKTSEKYGKMIKIRPWKGEAL